MTELNPTVTIIMPVYNVIDLVREAIQSVVNQTFTDWELLVIDDGSTDGTDAVVLECAREDKRIRVLTHRHNKGLVPTLNYGLAVARGTFIARLDGDDVWVAAEKLARQVVFLSDNPWCNLLGTAAEFAGIDGVRMGMFNVPTTDQAIRRRILLKNPFVHSSVVMRATVVRRLGGYRPAWRHVEDYDLWLRFGLEGGVANLPEAYTLYRVNPAGITAANNLGQIARCRQLVTTYRRSYPFWPIAWLKWAIQYILIACFGAVAGRFVKSIFGPTRRWFRAHPTSE